MYVIHLFSPSLVEFKTRDDGRKDYVNDGGMNGETGIRSLQTFPVHVEGEAAEKCISVILFHAAI